jgi:hypothetical protein
VATTALDATLGAPEDLDVQRDEAGVGVKLHRVKTSIHVRHTGHELPEIIRASFQILEQLPRLADRVADFRAFNLVVMVSAAAGAAKQKSGPFLRSDPAEVPLARPAVVDVRLAAGLPFDVSGPRP